jgi:Brp/Blh family beta-carotene 15,15'-monooxygenase
MRSTSSSRYHWHLLGVPWAIMLATAILAQMFPLHAQQWGVWILLASGLLLGMPHGACDLWALRNVQSRPITAQQMALVVAAYTAVALLTLALWWWNSGVALLMFLLVTVWHFGSGDTWLHALRSSAWPLGSVGRGLIVMCAPLALQPEATQEILGSFILLSARRDSIAFLWTLAPYLLMLGLLLQTVACLVHALQSAPLRKLKSDVTEFHTLLIIWIETALLIALFAWTPPLLAIACYFMGVHAWRHMLRLELARKGQRSTRIRLWRVMLQQHRHSIVLTLITYIGILPILWAWPALLQNATQWSVAYLVLVSAVTVPHVGLILWLELRGNLARAELRPIKVRGTLS